MMMRRSAILPTILVAIAVAVMIGLGVWQLQRRSEKAAVLAVTATNPAKPAISFPTFPPVPRDLLFRPSSVNCLRVAKWRIEAGRAADGKTGYRHIAECSTGAEGPGALVVMGVTQRPDAKTAWTGGLVRGWLSEEPDHRSLLVRLTGNAPPLRPMLIAREPAPALRATAPPTADDIPDNHLAYAVQWFLFAGIAVVIYVIALRRRTGPSTATKP